MCHQSCPSGHSEFLAQVLIFFPLPLTDNNFLIHFSTIEIIKWNSFDTQISQRWLFLNDFRKIHHFWQFDGGDVIDLSKLSQIKCHRTSDPSSTATIILHHPLLIPRTQSKCQTFHWFLNKALWTPTKESFKTQDWGEINERRNVENFEGKTIVYWIDAVAIIFCDNLVLWIIRYV